MEVGKNTMTFLGNISIAKRVLTLYSFFSWAHGALSALADRIKIARNAVGDDINLSIQYILNCGGGEFNHIMPHNSYCCAVLRFNVIGVAGSCWGGSHSGVYEFVKVSVQHSSESFRHNFQHLTNICLRRKDLSHMILVCHTLHALMIATKDFVLR